MRIALLAVLLAGCSAARAQTTLPPSSSGAIRVGDISHETVADIAQAAAKQIQAGEKELLFVIDSFGGSIFDGLDLIKFLELQKKRRGLTYTCVVDTSAMSMGFVFLQAVCDKRLMTKRSILLAHNGSGAVRGTAEELEKAASFLRALSDAMAELCARRLKITPAEFKAKIAHGDWVFGWEEALQVGAVDGVVDHADLPADA